MCVIRQVEYSVYILQHRFWVGIFLNIKSREVWSRNIPAVNFQLHCILSTFINSSRTALHSICFGVCIYIYIYIYTPYFWNWKLLGWLHNTSGFQDKLYFYIYKFLRDTLKVLWLCFFREVDMFLFSLTYIFLYFSFSLFTVTMLATLISLVRNGKERGVFKGGW